MTKLVSIFRAKSSAGDVAARVNEIVRESGVLELGKEERVYFLKPFIAAALVISTINYIIMSFFVGIFRDAVVNRMILCIWVLALVVCFSVYLAYILESKFKFLSLLSRRV